MRVPFNDTFFLSTTDIKHAIFSNLQQSQAILTCAMLALEFVCTDITLGRTTIYNVLWAMDDYLEELAMLFEQLEKLSISQ